MSKTASGCGGTTRDALGCELATKVIRSHGKLRFRAKGASMLPTIWPGDILTISGKGVLAADVGEIILYSRQGRLVAHRLVERRVGQDGIEWVTRGDRMEGNDVPISSHELLGRITSIQRGSRLFTPRPSTASRLASGILRRSDFATRVLLKLARVGREFLGSAHGAKEPGFAMRG